MICYFEKIALSLEELLVIYFQSLLEFHTTNLMVIAEAIRNFLLNCNFIFLKIQIAELIQFIHVEKSE